MDCSHCVSVTTCGFKDKASAIENKCNGWKRKSCNTCQQFKMNRCRYLKDLDNPPLGKFYCFEWVQIPYKAILKIPGMRFSDYHKVNYWILDKIGLRESDLLQHIPPEDEGGEVTVMMNIEKIVSLIYFPVYSKYVFINNSGLEVKEENS